MKDYEGDLRNNANLSLISVTVAIFQNGLLQNRRVYSILPDSITFLSESCDPSS